jgi:hypothetical protein
LTSIITDKVLAISYLQRTLFLLPTCVSLSKFQILIPPTSLPSSPLSLLGSAKVNVIFKLTNFALFTYQHFKSHPLNSFCKGMQR